MHRIIAQPHVVEQFGDRTFIEGKPIVVNIPLNLYSHVVLVVGRVGAGGTGSIT